jgi:hypothetical protein
MRAILKITLVLAGIVAAVPACGSDPADALAGKWTGQCTTSDGASGDLTLTFSKDGKYTQVIDGTDTSISSTETDGSSSNLKYSVKGDSLTVIETDKTTCDLKRS